MIEPLRIFVGYDSRENDAFEVCRRSLLNTTSVPISITPLDQMELRRIGLYRRAGEDGKDVFDGKPFSTEFSFTRFLVPHLSLYRGWALFVDCDFLFRTDVSKLFALKTENKAVMCVHHSHVPDEVVKMDGVPQTIYHRKNWSSLVLWNCSHPDNKNLSIDDVNTKPGAWLHGFKWISDTWKIGFVPESWNWLEGTSPKNIIPDAVHFTRGGPWFDKWKNVDYADEWNKVLAEVE